MNKLILASNSDRRKQILKDHKFKFEVISANIDEEKYNHLHPIEMVKTLSRLKAEKIAKKKPNSIILGADTTVVLEKENIGKPKNLDDAHNILSKLSSSTHKVHTGYTIIIPLGKSITSYETTKITFKKLSEKQINDYIHLHNVLDYAGSYAIQEGADSFVKNFEGDYLNILGLPKKALELLDKNITISK